MNTKTSQSIKTEAGDIITKAASNIKDAAKTAMSETTEMAQNRLEDLSSNISELQDSTEEYLKRNIWATVGISVGLGAILGIALSRR
jgi:ElaB/YqjD/DUF883 family membrane-anchored ribosome-binding protein